MDATAEKQAAAAGVEVVGDESLMGNDVDVSDVFLFEKEAGDFSARMGVGCPGLACASHGLLIAGGRMAADHQGDGDEQKSDDEDGHLKVSGAIGALSIRDFQLRNQEGSDGLGGPRARLDV